jgi:hypothetical protein
MAKNLNIKFTTIQHFTTRVADPDQDSIEVCGSGSVLDSTVYGSRKKTIKLDPDCPKIHSESGLVQPELQPCLQLWYVR